MSGLRKLPTLTALKRRARECGATEDQLDDADDAPEGVRVAVIDLIMGRQDEAFSPSSYGP